MLRLGLLVGSCIATMASAQAPAVDALAQSIDEMRALTDEISVVYYETDAQFETALGVQRENYGWIASVEAIRNREDAYKKALWAVESIHDWWNPEPHLRLIDGYLAEFPDGKHVQWFNYSRLVWDGESIESDGKPVQVLIDEARRFDRFLEQYPDVEFEDEVRFTAAQLWSGAAQSIWEGDAESSWTGQDAERFARKARQHLNESEDPDQYLLKQLRRGLRGGFRPPSL